MLARRACHREPGAVSRGTLWAVLGVVAAATAFAGTRPAAALPAFARAYDLHCGVCHAALPHLNAYGLAFRERGYALPGTVPGSALSTLAAPRTAAARSIGFWTRGSVFERADFRRGHDRTDAEAPSRNSAYLVSPLAAHTHLFLEGEAALRQIESRPGGRFSRTTEVTLARGFVTADLAALARALRGEDAGWREIGPGFGPILTIGRFDPSSLFAYPTLREALHSLPGDTERSADHSDIQRFPLVPYAFGARFFGLFDRSGHVLLPTAESLFNTRGNLGGSLHGRLGGLPLAWSVGVLNGANPRFPDTGETADPYVTLRYDVSAGETAGSLSALLDYGPGTAEVRFTEREAADGEAGRRTVDWLRAGVGAAVSRRALGLRGAFFHDRLFRVPGAIDQAFDATSAGLSFEADYRITPDWLASMRYDWMDPGGFASSLAGLGGPHTGQALHAQIRWYFMQGRTRPRSADVLAAVSLRDSVNLAPGGSRNPLRAWENIVVIGIDVAH
jgi:hypothetical protein